MVRTFKAFTSFHFLLDICFTVWKMCIVKFLTCHKGKEGIYRSNKQFFAFLSISGLDIGMPKTFREYMTSTEDNKIKRMHLHLPPSRPWSSNRGDYFRVKLYFDLCLGPVSVKHIVFVSSNIAFLKPYEAIKQDSKVPDHSTLVING